jgi:hypothetical protein
MPNMFNWYNWYWEGFKKRESYLNDFNGRIEVAIPSTILGELEKKAQVTDSTLNQLIVDVLVNYVKTNDTPMEQPDNIPIWACPICETNTTFLDHTEYVKHFYENHQRTKVPS